MCRVSCRLVSRQIVPLFPLFPMVRQIRSTAIVLQTQQPTTPIHYPVYNMFIESPTSFYSILRIRRCSTKKIFRINSFLTIFQVIDYERITYYDFLKKIIVCQLNTTLDIRFRQILLLLQTLNWGKKNTPSPLKLKSPVMGNFLIKDKLLLCIFFFCFICIKLKIQINSLICEKKLKN